MLKGGQSDAARAAFEAGRVDFEPVFAERASASNLGSNWFDWLIAQAINGRSRLHSSPGPTCRRTRLPATLTQSRFTKAGRPDPVFSSSWIRRLERS